MPVIWHMESVAIESNPLVEEVTAGDAVNRLRDWSAAHLPERMADFWRKQGNTIIAAEIRGDP